MPPRWRGERSGRLHLTALSAIGMMRRLEQVAALVVAAGLALVSYWLFFSWAQGGGAQHRAPGQAPARTGQPVAPRPAADAAPPPALPSGASNRSSGDSRGL